METLAYNEIENVFKQMKQGKRAEKVFPNADTKQYYFFYKAHKLANLLDFTDYWSKQTDKQILRDILKEHYPPLGYNHKEKGGYPNISYYVKIAKTIF